MTIPRMRTIKQLTKEMREMDPQTSLSESSIRRLLKEGKLHSVRVGNKHMLNLDQCIEFFNTSSPEPELTKNLIEGGITHVSDNRLEQFKSNIKH